MKSLANAPTLVAWTRGDNEDSSPLTFDLRLVQNDADAGLALANLSLDEGTDSGNGNVVFPSAGTFVLKAVTRNTNIGTSNKIVILPPISTTSSGSTSATATMISATSTTSGITTTAPSGPESTTMPPPSSPSSSTASTSSTSATPTSSRTAAKSLTPHPNLPALVGGILGSLTLLALLAALAIFLHRKRNAIRKRLTFNRDMMVQRRSAAFASLGLGGGGRGGNERAPTLPPIEPRASATFARDIEAGLVDSEHDINNSAEHQGESTERLVVPHLGTGHIVPSPKGPRAKRIATVVVQRSVGSPLSSPRIAASIPGVLASSSTPGPASTPTAGAIAVPAPPTSPAPTPLPAPPRTRRQKDLLARSGMLRRQMADLQLELDRLSLRSPSTTVSFPVGRSISSPTVRDSTTPTLGHSVSLNSPAVSSPVVASPMTTSSAPQGRAAEIRAALADMQRQMVWLKEQEGSMWALGMTDVMPAGHERYLRP
ncbi:hypothetical protein BDN70DRAFT_353929 [Pholiota conissans]|uniref:Uncharacterized protein n=1 Tax=Pholiota conissans TaxID=109636 RepID=A0A9P5YQY5_9AGAR|nr:hypothetical protein BDN70DRAFT_353929 [Pholiota conissans]